MVALIDNVSKIKVQTNKQGKLGKETSKLFPSFKIELEVETFKGGNSCRICNK